MFSENPEACPFPISKIHATKRTQIATISSLGVKAGVCVITAQAHNGISRSCEVTVLQAVTSIKLNKAKAVLNLYDTPEEADASVVITRTRDDVNLTNIERAEILNNAGVNIALQVHCNGSDDKSQKGLSVYYRTTGSG